MSETVIRISDNGRITVEIENRGVKSFKQIAPDTLVECINKSLLRGAVHTGITQEGHIASCKLGVIENSNRINPNTKMYHYPLSNVSGFHICTGNNTFPKCTSLHTLSSLPYYIMSMPNNNDHFNPSLNKLGMEMRDLLELLKTKEPTFYYSNVLLPNGKVLNDFIQERKK